MPPRKEALGEAKLERASSACRHAGGVSSGSTKPFGRATISGERGDAEHIGGQVPPEDHAAVPAAAAAAVLARATEVEHGNAPPWRADDEYASEVLFDVISSRSALSGPGNDG